MVHFKGRFPTNFEAATFGQGIEARGQYQRPLGLDGNRRRWQAKRKGLQLALEPLNGRGIAGYVPKP
jgi:hypothetical protein